MGYVRKVSERSNHAHMHALLAGGVGALLGQWKPNWFGSVGQAATMAAIAPLTFSAVLKTTRKATKEWDFEGKDYLILALAGGVGFMSPKAASFFGYETTWKHALTMAVPGALCATYFDVKGPNRHRKMGKRIPPLVWAALGYGAGQFFPQWIKPIDGAKLMGLVSMTDLTLSHLSKKDDSPSLDRAVMGMAFLAALANRYSPNNWKPLAVATGIFYGQQALRHRFPGKQYY